MDASLLTPTTELEAVNDMLSAIGESPVATLEGTLSPDAQQAKQLLAREARAVQAQGWNWNSDENVRFVPDNDGHINLPTNLLKCSATDPTDNIVWRGTRLWDKVNQTDVFDRPVYLDVVYMFDFSDLPEPARRYIYLVASKKFENRIVGDGGANQIESQDAILAKADLMQHECESANLNIVDHSPTVNRIVLGITGTRSPAR